MRAQPHYITLAEEAESRGDYMHAAQYWNYAGQTASKNHHVYFTNEDRAKDLDRAQIERDARGLN